MILTLVYFGGVVLAVYPIFTAMLADFPSRYPPDDADRAFAGALAVLCAPFWPVALVGWLTFRLSRRLWRRVLPVDDREKERSA